MKPREAFAWFLVAVVALAAWLHWSTLMNAWKYRSELGQASELLEGLQQTGVIR
jgi:hypothetical protein